MESPKSETELGSKGSGGNFPIWDYGDVPKLRVYFLHWQSVFLALFSKISQLSIFLVMFSVMW